MTFPAPNSAPRVLLVNDDVSVSDMFCRALRLEGFDVWNGLSPKEGLALADKHFPHAIILDLRMPLDSVIELVRNLKRVPRLTHTPVALITSDYYVEAPDVDLLRSLGATLYYKPLWLSELVEIARSLVVANVGPAA